MTEPEIVELVNKVFENAFEIEKEKIKPEAHIFMDLGLDSLDIVDLVVELQKGFKIEITDNEKLREIRTLQDIYDFVSTTRAEMGK
ncbi:MAG: acyl carrier protein [Nitrospinota bacterium]|nr:acyl carrier protein [Nitrospinota bacterium]MDH5677123.1 acyl carrier protein [Nitrospinota bacterium]MDH5755875.1 acyl carrier protein [Nitrospinota bacterium]